MSNQRCVSCIIVGGGERGLVYASYSLDFPSKLNVIALCEPREHRKALFQEMFQLNSNQIYNDWRDINESNLADCVCICVQDQLHKDCCIHFAKLGYHILLEKPMAVTEEDCKDIASVCSQSNIIFIVCHVLRYAPHNTLIKRLIDDGSIGQLINIEHTEPVGFYHFAHSFVRGNWRKEESSSFSMLTKCCHDIDLIKNWMKPYKCLKVISFGSLSHFSSTNQPQEAKDLNVSRCTDCPDSVKSLCPYDAYKIYVKPASAGVKSWPVSVIMDKTDFDIEDVISTISKGPYGRCVYKCDNDVCDNQQVLFEFEGGRTATLNMIAFTEKLCERKTVIRGSKGEITCTDPEQVSLFNFNTKETTTYDTSPNDLPTRMKNHGYADFHLMDTFVRAVSFNDPSLITTDALDALDSHLLVYRIEESRKQQKIINLE
jgi:predicted dehydrogenase